MCAKHAHVACCLQVNAVFDELEGISAEVSEQSDTYSWAVMMLHAWLGHSPLQSLSLQDARQVVLAGSSTAYCIAALEDAPSMHPSLKELLRVCCPSVTLLHD